MTPQGRRAVNQYISTWISKPIHSDSQVWSWWLEVMRWEPPWKRIAGIKLKAIQAAPLRHPSTHARAHPPLRRGMRMCCNLSLRSPLIVFIIHSSPCHPLASLFCPFSQSHPPYFHLIPAFRSLSKKKKKKKKTTHTCVCGIPARACGWRGPVPTQGSTVWRVVMQRNAKISSVPLRNGVSMATKGAKPCDAVSTTEDFKP